MFEVHDINSYFCKTQIYTDFMTLFFNPKKISLLIFFIISADILFAYNLRQISKYDGLSNSAILSMCQDSDGLMWFGSVDGLNLYDGRTLRIYKPAGGGTLSGNLIEDIIEGKPGIFWIQTNYGLNRFDKRRQTIVQYNMYSSNYRLRKGGDIELLFVRENNELVYYNEMDSSFDHLQLEGIDYANLLDYLVCEDNTVWLLCKGGQSAAWSLVRDEDGSRMLAPATLFEHPYELLYAFHQDGVVYFVDTEGILYEYDTHEKKKYYVADISAEISRNGDISSIVKSNGDFFVAFQTNGLICLRNTPDRAQYYQVEQIDVRAGVFCLLKDRRQDIVWIGTDGQGVYVYFNDSYSVKSTVFESFTHKVNKPVRAIFLDAQGTLWVATKGDGIFRVLDYDFNRSISEHRIEYVNTRNSGLRNNLVYSLSGGTGNILWIGSDGGIDYYDYKSGKIRPLDVAINGEGLKYVHGIVQLDGNTLWIATVGTGMVRADLRWDGDVPRVVSAERFTIGDGSMSSNYFFTVNAGGPESVWFGNRGYGAYRCDTGTGLFESVRFDHTDANRTLNDIFAIMKGRDGVMWFATSAGLVKRMPDGEYKVYNEGIGFPNSTIHGMLAGNHGNIWLSTNFGIIRFNPDTETFVTYSHNAPSDVIEFSDGAFFKADSDGKLFFGGINGFAVICENDYDRAEYVPPIVMDRLAIFGEDRNIYDYFSKDGRNGPTLNLDYRENFFSLSFAAIDYINGHNYSYMYKLEGMNDVWIDNGLNNTIYFTNISPGHYALRLKCRNMEAGSESDYTVNIHIRPPWYMSPLAYIMYGLLTVAVLWLAISFIRKRNELKRKTMLDNLCQEHEQEVYESKLKFFTNIAHEFCTPLTLIQGPCDRILAHKGSDPFVLRYAGLIQRNAERLNDLIHDLIEFRRIETGNKTPYIEPLDVSALVSTVADNFNELAESRGFTFSHDIVPGIIWNTDRGFMITVLNNLISNAFKYTNRQGRIGVTLGVDGDELKLEVSNTGKGIRAENIKRVFDRYSILEDFEHQNDTTQTRNGLGLAISSNMVKLLGGRIEVSSERNVETRFIVQLPIARPLPANQVEPVSIGGMLPQLGPVKDHSAKAEIPKYAFDERKPTVIVIDDDRDMLWFTSEIFAQDYNVIPVNRASQVDRILGEVHPNVIICDVMMPEVDGITITKRIKENPKTAHLPLILVSAKHRIDEQIEGLEAGADLYITKPFNVDYLKAFVRHLISRKETLKEYFASPISAYELTGGRMTHVDHRKFVQQILDVINANLTRKDLSAQFIADKMNMSARHLYRKIQEAGAESPLRMIHDCRLHVARDLLQNTTMTIDEIIYKSGFLNRGPFFRAFAEKFGCTPREYREKHIKGVE